MGWLWKWSFGITKRYYYFLLENPQLKMHYYLMMSVACCSFIASLSWYFAGLMPSSIHPLEHRPWCFSPWPTSHGPLDRERCQRSLRIKSLQMDEELSLKLIYLCLIWQMLHPVTAAISITSLTSIHLQIVSFWQFYSIWCVCVCVCAVLICWGEGTALTTCVSLLSASALISG